ncbi:MAG: DUF4870 domain-containing protein [Anaerolineae bacterium]|nr:DUF4870 domain-containing protein [Anaerolineae bacterium]
MSPEKQLSQEERLMAALAHASIVMNMMGPVVGVLIYITQKERSAYAARQGLQAAIYQIIGTILIIISWFCWGGFYALTFIPLIANAEAYQDAPPPIFWVGIGSMICPFILMAAWGLYGLYGAIRTWQGADFRYAFVGKLMDRQF